MVDERDDKYDQEEGEYHFSEDQVNYDAEPEAAPQPVAKNTFVERVSPYRRYIIGGVVFAILLVVVYRMLLPGTTEPETIIMPAAAVTSTKVTQTTAPQPQTPTVPMEQPNPLAPPTPGAASVPNPQGTTSAGLTETPKPTTESILPPPVAPTTEATGGSMLPPPPVSTTTASTLPPPPIPSSSTVGTQGALPPQPVPSQTTITTTTTEDKNVVDRLATLEEQNNKLMGLLQSEYTRKMAQQAAQNAALLAKVQELNARIACLEGNIRKPCATVARPPCAVPRPCPCAPRMIYTVQAIIPGRAWLKADTGDTVTVAEGDILKDYGRISKIDPYDGVVEIDTGNKLISLSYGTNGV